MRISDWSSDVCSSDLALIDEEQKRQAQDLIEWVSRADQMGAEAVARDLADVSAYLGQSFEDWASAEAALEAHVRTADPEEDAALIRLFGAIEGRRMQVWGQTSIGHAAQHVTRSEEHTSELQSLMRISYAVFCL